MFITYGDKNQFLKTRINVSKNIIAKLASADIFNPVKLQILLGNWNNGAFDVHFLQVEPFERHVRNHSRSFLPLKIEKGIIVKQKVYVN
jgi:hypothetical protein